MPITDAFTGTNGTGLPSYSADWAYTKGATTALQIQSNGVRCAAVFASAACERTEASFPADQHSQLTIQATGGTYIGAAIRCQGPATDSYYAYAGNSGNSYLVVYIDGVLTQLGSSFGGFAATDVIDLEVVGTTFTPTKNGSGTDTPGAQTDATYAGGKPGLYGWRDNEGTYTIGDSFECTDVPPEPIIAWISA